MSIAVITTLAGAALAVGGIATYYAGNKDSAKFNNACFIATAAGFLAAASGIGCIVQPSDFIDRPAAQPAPAISTLNP